jgi:uncharacterized protein (DUF2237 family)
MRNCCKHTKKDKKCIRGKDSKVFDLPRRFTRIKCKNPRGFTMRSSCAPYKYCKQKGGKSYRKSYRKSYKKNILNKRLKVCSLNPLTGYYRDGYCMTGADDMGTHTVCGKMTKEFLDYTKSKGNDLYSVAKPGDKWCLCEYRWHQAFKDGMAPKVYLEGTNNRTKRNITKRILRSNKKGRK